MQNNSQTKYYKLTEYLKEEILLGRIKPGEQIPSENMLTEKFSLSRHTVRKAISILANEGFIYTEHGRGTYCLDRSSTRNVSRNIGVVTTYISEYIFPKVIQGIDNVLSGSGYSIVLKNTNNDTGKEAYCLEDVLQKNIEGLIIEPTKSALELRNMKYYEALDRHGIPYIFIHGYYRQLESKPRVLLDDLKGMYLAVAYLIKLGHKNIAGIFKSDDIQGLERHRGYVGALSEAGLPYNPELVVWFGTEEQADNPYCAIRHMLEGEIKPDAIACYNDVVAFRVFELLNGLGVKVPEDISITGFDDSYISESCPVKITSVSHPKERLGEAAAQILLEMLKSKDYLKMPVQRVMEPELVIRESCRKR
ncbi:arabinose metabolism transcriptional repressor [Ruminiclostridium hungatei]|uniref:Arabinose metabolism transcriptional repressor n=1 Tax=Ruminiclostridium hungatei TaxID=48256 RepID=A0A1V4SF02_RUMHU|nr:GntR family transcriptional regulator [Ruminiclostridium hungatei]OPX42430.1 arabinose metabolism transcriptional repressor [Ruminiclostridium hungatei]